jgi:hypothetical protein
VLGSVSVHDVTRSFRYAGCWSGAFKMRFPPSVVEAQHGWRSAPHLEGRNEVENRNGASVMEVAVMGSRAKLGTKEGGKFNGATCEF